MYQLATLVRRCVNLRTLSIPESAAGGDEDVAISRWGEVANCLRDTLRQLAFHRPITPEGVRKLICFHDDGLPKLESLYVAIHHAWPGEKEEEEEEEAELDELDDAENDKENADAKTNEISLVDASAPEKKRREYKPARERPRPTEANACASDLIAVARACPSLVRLMLIDPSAGPPAFDDDDDGSTSKNASNANANASSSVDAARRAAREAWARSALSRDLTRGAMLARCAVADRVWAVDVADDFADDVAASWLGTADARSGFGIEGVLRECVGDVDAHDDRINLRRAVDGVPQPGLEPPKAPPDPLEGVFSLFAKMNTSKSGGVDAGGETASHTTPFAWCTPFLKDFSRRHSSPAFPFQRLTGTTCD